MYILINMGFIFWIYMVEELIDMFFIKLFVMVNGI